MNTIAKCILKSYLIFTRQLLPIVEQKQSKRLCLQSTAASVISEVPAGTPE